MPDLFEQFTNIGREASGIPANQKDFLLPVTVRLDPTIRCRVDTLASHAAMSRQSLLSRIIESGIDTAIEAFLEGAPDRSQDFAEDLEHCIHDILMEGP
mgnify:FL=1